MARSSGKRARRGVDEFFASTSNKQRKQRTEVPETGVSTAPTFREVKPLNYIQETYLEAIQNNDIVFGIGSAGTGKTYVAASYAAQELFYKRVDRIILTRPNVETGRGLGFYIRTC